MIFRRHTSEFTLPELKAPSTTLPIYHAAQRVVRGPVPVHDQPRERDTHREQAFRNFYGNWQDNFMFVKSNSKQIGLLFCMPFNFLVIHFYCILQKHQSMTRWQLRV